MPAAAATSTIGDARATWAIAPGVLLAGIAGGIAFPILPSAAARAGVAIAFVGVILAANRLTRIVTNPLVGLVVDRIGGRRTFLVGLALQLVVIGLYRIGVTTGNPGPYFLIGRILHGPGSSGVIVAGQALALNLAGTGNVGRVGGVVRGSSAIGVPLGLVMGGVLSDRIGDARTFDIAALSIVLAFVAAFAVLPDVRVHAASKPSFFRAIGALFEKRLAALGGLYFASTFAGSGTVLTTMVLLVHERNIHLLKWPEKTTSSLLMGWLIISEGLSMPFWGRLGDRKHAHAAVGAVGVVVAIPALLIIGFAPSLVLLATGVGILGLSVGALGPSILALVSEVVPPERRGVAIGGLAVCSDIGGALGPLLGTALFAEVVALPYVVSAIVMVGFVPVAIWLARVARKAQVADT